MRNVAIGILLSAGFASFAVSAEDDVMAGFYGNTAVGTGGRVDTHTAYFPDHTFDTKVPALGLEFKGTWKLTGATLCRLYETPPPDVPNPFCTPIEAHKVGDTWTVTLNGQSRTITLVKGIQ